MNLSRGNNVATKAKLFGLGNWELNVLVAEAVILSGLVWAGAWYLLCRVFHLPNPVGMGFGFFLLWEVNSPTSSLFAKAKGREYSVVRDLLRALGAGVLMALVSYFWR